jgi:hypothetical protein
MKDLEKIAYHLYVRGTFSKKEIKNLIRDGKINYYGYYLYDPVEKELGTLASLSGSRSRGWEYEDWEIDFAPKEKVVSEFLDLLESRTKDESEIELNPGLTRKPKIVETPQLKKTIRASLEKGRGVFIKSLSILIPSFDVWQDGAFKITQMSSIELYEAISTAIEGKNGNFGLLWDFLEYSGYITPDYSGPVVTAYRKILKGVSKDLLGQYQWILEHKEFLDAFHLVQAQLAIATIFGKIIRDNPALYKRKLDLEFHPFAYSCGIIYYSALRWRKEGEIPCRSNEHIPLWNEVLEIASPPTWALVHHMDESSASQFMGQFFDLLYEKRVSLPDIALKVLLKESEKFSRDLEKKEFVERIKKKFKNIKYVKKVPVLQKQRQALFAHEWWGKLFSMWDETKADEFLLLWWKSLQIDLKGFGTAWLTSELTWEPRIIGYEPYLNMRKFNGHMNSFLIPFYSIYAPKGWDSSET